MDSEQPPAKKRIRGANWTEVESHWLAVAKRQEWQDWKAKNPRGNMVPDQEKWEKVVKFLESAGVRGRDRVACSMRWDYLLKIWRCIRDMQLKETGNQDFWALSAQERSALKLPSFSKELYNEMDWLMERACNQPKATSSSMVS